MDALVLGAALALVVVAERYPLLRFERAPLLGPFVGTDLTMITDRNGRVDAFVTGEFGESDSESDRGELARCHHGMKLTNAPVLANFTPNHCARRLAPDGGSILDQDARLSVERAPLNARTCTAPHRHAQVQCEHGPASDQRPTQRGVLPTPVG